MAIFDSSSLKHWPQLPIATECEHSSSVPSVPVQLTSFNITGTLVSELDDGEIVIPT